MAARFVNDAIRFNAMYPRDPGVALQPRADFRPWADEIAVDRLLPCLLDTILVQDAPRSCALVDSYLERTAERQELMETIAYRCLPFPERPPHSAQLHLVDRGVHATTRRRAATTFCEGSSSISRATSSARSSSRPMTSTPATSILPIRNRSNGQRSSVWRAMAEGLEPRDVWELRNAAATTLVRAEEQMRLVLSSASLETVVALLESFSPGRSPGPEWTRSFEPLIERLWLTCDPGLLAGVEANFRARGPAWAAIANSLTEAHGAELRGRIRRHSAQARLPAMTIE